MILNLFGSPGTGKSTTRAGIFYHLKQAGVNCEEVTEFAKKLTWHGRGSSLACQPYVFGKQLHELEMLEGKVDVVITDSPLLLSRFFGEKYCGDRYASSFYDFILDQFNQMDNRNYFLKRTKVYNPAGRNQTEEESNQFAVEMEEMLDRHQVSYDVINADALAAERIAQDILRELGR